ncbi:phosphotransferase [Brachybacterium saurashtrense]|uniref:Aminoglycoside phosphotransferase n=1 Tax=Brachybacterium saurashtrense TaxID=556288 RepID=A0A345YL88_9MICO|nr:phosphotransferase [Brachybacterium saurashtrense]AXK44690.1 aminoglycoside phosphotransferase [Brachybacterium saurashtrense]RRR23302.1 aminoglycoside phosphotransferase [Brachybacterium saurashtrense]
MHRNSYSLAALAAAAVPGMVPARTMPIATPAEDLDVAGILGEDGRRVMVLSPASTAAGVRLERDLKVADALTGTSLRGVIPPVLGFVKLTEGGRCAVTEAPVGRPLMLEDLSGSEALARSLGQVLARIHTVPRYAAEAAGVESFTSQVLHAEHRARVAALTEAGHLPAAVAQRWQALLEDEELWDFTPQFVHGDLSEESLFLSGDQVSAVRDWSSSKVADAASDLAWLISSLDPDRFDALCAAYREELPTSAHPRLMERAQALGEFAVAEWLAHGLEVEDPEIVADARGMIADLDADLAQLARDEAERTYEEMSAREDDRA